MGFKDLELDPATLNHVGKIGQAMILDAILPEDDDPSNLPLENDAGAGLRGSIEEVEAYHADFGEVLGSPKAGPFDPNEDQELPGLDSTWCRCLLLLFCNFLPFGFCP